MPPALQFLVLTFAGWVNRHQDDLIAYLREENRVLREHLGCGWRIRKNSIYRSIFMSREPEPSAKFSRCRA